MSLFRKPKKNIQRRAFSDFPDHHDGPPSMDVDVEEKSVEKPTKSKEKAQKSTASKTLLSFGDEEGKFLRPQRTKYLQ